MTELRRLAVHREVRGLAALPHARTPVLCDEDAWSWDGRAWLALGAGREAA